MRLPETSYYCQQEDGKDVKANAMKYNFVLLAGVVQYDIRQLCSATDVREILWSFSAGQGRVVQKDLACM